MKQVARVVGWVEARPDGGFGHGLSCAETHHLEAGIIDGFRRGKDCWRISTSLARLYPSYGLDHPFRQVRRGAVQAIAGLKDADLLQQLDKARAASEDPVFRHAAYRAIDTGLKRMEIVNQAETLEKLRHWQRGTADNAIKDRLAWTIGWVEYRAGLRERGMAK